MTEDSTQLSVAELLARNGQEGAPAPAASGGGGGRRRRSGRGISVADLTGDMPVLPGSSSHAAPEEDGRAESESAPIESDYSNYSNYSGYSHAAPDSGTDHSPLSGPISFYDPLASSGTPSAPSLSEPSGYNWNTPGQNDWQPTESAPDGRNSANGYGAHSNGYGSSTGGRDAEAYDADSGYGAQPNGRGTQANGYSGGNGYGSGYEAGGNGYDADGYGAHGNGYGANGYAAQGYGTAQDNGHAPTVDRQSGGRRRKPDPLSSPLDELGYGGAGADSSAAAPPAPTPSAGTGGRRRRKFDPDDETTEVRPFRGPAPVPDAGLDLPPWGAREAEQLPGNPPERGATAPAPPMSRSARRHAERQAEEAQRGVEAPHAAESWHGAGAPLDDESRRVAELLREGAPRRGADIPQAEPWRGAEPPREADRRGADPRGADPRAADPRGADPHGIDPRGADARRNGAVASGAPAWSARRRQATEPAPAPTPSQPDDPTSAWQLAREDQQMLSGETVAGDLLRDAHDRDDEPRSRRSRRSGERSFGKGGFGRKSRAADPDEDYEGATDIYSPLLEDDEIDDNARPSVAERFRALATRVRRPSKTSESDDDENRRQWLILGGQSTGAAVAGMLLFKGFERLWEMLPWVALALAMIVILGLVALVRVLRRTDDIFSTVIAVVVGVFVTLGPLAFLLSTT
uniref:hypothetical protein n=1 Tax=Nocardia uniformis TaxID=53432 RepID=UPI00082EED96|nr:hypothetical protein [Nocardia uniformis]